MVLVPFWDCGKLIRTRSLESFKKVTALMFCSSGLSPLRVESMLKLVRQPLKENSTPPNRRITIGLPTECVGGGCLGVGVWCVVCMCVLCVHAHMYTVRETHLSSRQESRLGPKRLARNY